MFSVVYKCTLPQTGLVAVKLFGRSHDAYVREVRVASSLEHPHFTRLVKVLDLQPLCIAYQFHRGGTLYSLLEDNVAKATTPQLVKAMADVASALAHLHSQHVLHRAVKPENIFLTEEAQTDPAGDVLLFPPVVLGDLGIAPIHLDPEGETVSYRSNFWYTAPETLVWNEHSLHADVFSFGVCLYVVVTGMLPPSLPSAKRVLRHYAGLLRGERYPLGVLDGMKFGDVLAGIVAAAWHQEPAMRASASDLEKVLGALQ